MFSPFQITDHSKSCRVSPYRRRCLKPHISHRKLTLASSLDKKDQATSMSHLNLISNEVCMSK